MKSGAISVTDGFTNPAVLDAAIVPPTVNTGTLASIVQQLFDASEGLLCAVVHIGARTIRAKTASEGSASAGVATLIAAGEESWVFSKQDLTSRSSEWTLDGATPFDIGDGDGEPVQRLIKPEQPSLSTAQLIGRVEDATLLVGGDLEGEALVVIADQGTGKVTVVSFANIGAATTATGTFGGTIGYTQTITTGTGATRQPLE